MQPKTNLTQPYLYADHLREHTFAVVRLQPNLVDVIRQTQVTHLPYHVICTRQPHTLTPPPTLWTASDPPA